MKKSSSILAFWSFVSQTNAYWRMACSVSQTSRTDPILSPGAVSGHVHNFAGGINVNPSSTHDSLLGSSCSTCEVQDDKSAYWTPKLYFQYTDGTAREVPNGGTTVYYVGRAGNASDPAVPMPAGFRMVAGNSLLRSYDTQDVTYLENRPVADRVSFRCINDANDLTEQHYMFRTDCSNGLRAQINFPACWDGQNLYLDKSAHVAYLSDINGGVCPTSHPVPLPLLFLEVLYATNDVDQSSGGQFVFSNGDTTGYGFHGDFVNGWNMDVFDNAVQNCLYTDNNGVATACPVLAQSHTDDFSRICPEAPSVWDETVHGNLPGSLPGCNPLTSGPDSAVQVICPVNSSSPADATSTSVLLPSPTAGFGNISTSDSAGFTMSQTTSTATSLDTNTSPTTGPSQSSGGIFVTNSTAGPTYTSTSTTQILSTNLGSSGFSTVYVTQTSFVTLSSSPSTTNVNLVSSAASSTVVGSDTAITSDVANSSSDVCSLYSGLSMSGCITSSTTAIIPTATYAGFRRLAIRGRLVQ